jgi:hypothetical protein
MPVAGAIADRLKALIPITWDGLSNDPRVGDSALQSAIDVAKANVTGQVLVNTQEHNYPVIVVDYIAKIAAIELIPAGIDFWMNQSMSVSSTGTNESITYTDRADRLDSLRKEFISETRIKQQEVSKLIGYWVDDGRAVPQMSSANINPFHLTPSPEEFPRPYTQTQYS